MFGKHTQFDGWDLAGAQSSQSFFDDLDAMLQIPDNSGTSSAQRAYHNIAPTLEESRLNQTFDLLPEGALFVDATGKIARVNRQILSALNQLEERLLGKHFWDLISESDPLKPLTLEELFATDLSANILMNLRAARGETIMVSLNARRLICEESLVLEGYLITVQEFI